MLSDTPWWITASTPKVAQLCQRQSVPWLGAQTYDWQRIYDSMEKPAYVFDGRVMLDHAALRKIGFDVYCIGKPVEGKIIPSKGCNVEKSNGLC